MAIQLKIGSKGELFLPKKLRKEMKLHPGDLILIERNENIMTIRKTEDFAELFLDPPLTGKQTPKEIEDEINKMQKKQIESSIKEN